MLLRSERAATVVALFGVSALAWLSLFHVAGAMHGMSAVMPGMAMGDVRPAPWSGSKLVLMFVMWWVMMTGMMLPGAIPMILIFGTVNRRRRERGQAYLPSAVFAAGYLIAWGVFSLGATLAQWRLDQAALLLPSMKIGSALLGAALWVSAGLYQWSPLKRACLANCRSPIDFVVNRWRDGWLGALRMGVEHGAYCLGCCALLMALLFVGGVMNLLWVAVLAVFILFEKLLPSGQRVARVGGALMIAFGVFLLAWG
ncbi:MAG TPA: DUF2182 domain-containing protein [Burkholderiales bacterium]|nr:DUF2182 domain-containing protein [Burkholderiales bacterium]